MTHLKSIHAALLCVSLAFPSGMYAQQTLTLSVPASFELLPSAAAGTVAAPAAQVVKPWHSGLDRWFTLNEFDYAMRYRSVTDINGSHEFNQGQERTILDGRVKFDVPGRYALAFHASSGKYFNWAYADFAGGGNKQAFAISQAGATPAEVIKFGRAETVDSANFLASQASGGWSFYVRQLYLDLEPIKGFEVQLGGLDINRGAGSEITTYDNDGYISGERLLIKKPSMLFLDEVSVTYAYLGDVFKPNFFARTSRFTQSDYHQFMFRKHFHNRVDASFDYTWQNAANILHEDALVDIKESRVLDSVRVEYYQRLNSTYYPNVPHIATFLRTGGNGYAFTVSKRIKGLSVDAGLDSVDLQSGVLTQVGVLGVMGMAINGDQYGEGKRYFIRPAFKLNRAVEASGYYTQLYGTQSDPTQLIWNKQALAVGLTLDIKKALYGEKRSN